MPFSCMNSFVYLKIEAIGRKAEAESDNGANLEGTMQIFTQLPLIIPPGHIILNMTIGRI
jgi:hypothetical protein